MFFGIGADEIDQIADMIPSGSAVLFMLLEHLWAAELKEVVQNSNGSIVAQGFITPEMLIELGREFAIGFGNERSYSRPAGARNTRQERIMSHGLDCLHVTPHVVHHVPVHRLPPDLRKGPHRSVSSHLSALPLADRGDPAGQGRLAVRHCHEDGQSAAPSGLQQLTECGKPAGGEERRRPEKGGHSAPSDAVSARLVSACR